VKPSFDFQHKPVITQSDLFQGLADEDCDAIMSAGRLFHLKQGEFFFHQGEDAEMMYVLLTGRVKLSQVTVEGDQVIMNYFGPGNGLGIIVALGNMSYPLSIEAIEPCTAVGWSRDQMVDLMMNYPQLALNGISMIGHRFAKLQQRLQEMATERVEQRVARALLRLIRQFGRRTESGLLLDMPITREELAQLTGTNLYSVSRILSKWEQAGFISSGRKEITLLKAHELVAIAEDLPLNPAK